ncbi:MAG: prepilin-type N-terminal cleavage/methylation domain-containing protein [Gemmatimonadetes bacterium]|nr:prepilin-type N-terminal cleavage/methylation domain-containing protein [Gemmatimonadota bacterium]
MTARARGFTLVEIVVVLALLALSAAVSVPAFSAVATRSSTHEAAAQVTALLEGARSRALARGYESQLTIDAAHARVWQAEPDSTFVLDLPADCHLASDKARLHVRFAADGSAAADAIVVRCDRGTAVIAADAWTGATRVTEGR